MKWNEPSSRERRNVDKLIRVLVLLGLLASSLSCRWSTPDQADGLVCREVLAEFRGLTENLQVPENLLTEAAVESGGEFDVNAYFTALTHLSMEPGMVLDYFYSYNLLGGFPVVLARPESDPPYLHAEELGSEVAPFYEHVVVDGSAQGYLEYALLALLGDQFYLYWHALYNDTRVLCDRTDLLDVVRSVSSTDLFNRMPLPDRVRSLLIPDPRPLVRIQDGIVEVELTLFTKWGGFFRTTYRIQESFPHRILDVDEELLVPYECGILL